MITLNKRKRYPNKGKLIYLFLINFYFFRSVIERLSDKNKALIDEF